MSFTPHTHRVRVSKATEQRDANVRKLIAALRHGPLLRDEIRDLLGLSASGNNKYIALLREAGVIEMMGYVNPVGNSPGHPLYRLNRDAAVVDAYLRSLEEGSAKLVTLKDTSRHIHRLRDDGPESVFVPKRGIPAPDPVLAAFYGIAQAPA
jgi:DNA-binding transcriptional ArsR family regulator